MDQKARDILFKTYWTEEGLNPAPAISAEDFAYAKAQGAMFDPFTISEQGLFDKLTPLALSVRHTRETANLGEEFCPIERAFGDIGVSTLE